MRIRRASWRSGGLSTRVQRRSRVGSGVAGVVGVAGEDRACAVELLGEDEAREGVGEGEASEREQQGGAGAGCGRPTVGGADGKDDVLRALVAALAKPRCEGFRGELAAAAVEENRDGRRPGVLPVEPLEKGIFSPEGLGCCFGKDGAALKVEGSSKCQRRLLSRALNRCAPE